MLSIIDSVIKVRENPKRSKNMISQQKPLNAPQGMAITTFKRLLFVFVASGILLIQFSSASNAFIAEDISGGSQLEEGSLVSIKEDEPGYVELADASNASRLYGVIQNGDQASIRFVDEGSQVSVATSGEILALVSDVNGKIEQGDIVGASWIKGVGMRTDSSLSGRYLGVALESMGNSEASSFDNVETPTGKKTVNVQPLKIRILSGNLEGRQSESSSLQKLAGNLTGKQISTLRVAIAFVVFVISLVLCGFFITNAIRGSFLSIGRNPLASASIYSSLIQVSVMSIVIIVIGAVVAYAILLV